MNLFNPEDRLMPDLQLSFHGTFALKKDDVLKILQAAQESQGLKIPVKVSWQEQAWVMKSSTNKKLGYSVWVSAR